MPALNININSSSSDTTSSISNKRSFDGSIIESKRQGITMNTHVTSCPAAWRDSAMGWPVAPDPMRASFI
jgi:hypothetical protein